MPPAARLGDKHECPHGGGQIQPSCSPDVFINGLPAARLGDVTEDSIGHDPIVQGEPSVRINGKPAARLSDKTDHGGVITQGSPNVFIGPPFSGHCMKEAAANGTPFIRNVSV
jgi:uncharacterized Zn-binding protein involved in type VI secretion